MATSIPSDAMPRATMSADAGDNSADGAVPITGVTMGGVGTMAAEVVVVGAGIAGLTAADALARATAQAADGSAVPASGGGLLRVLVLEAQSEVGGRMRTHTCSDGFAVDMGATW